MKITVVIPTFNSEKTILRALMSVFAQSWPVHEVIVVDDGSSDNTVSMIHSEYPDKVTVIRHQQNAGPGAARNAGIDSADGDWIAFLDADDEWLPGKLKSQRDLLTRRPELAWCCTNYTITKNERRVPKINPCSARSDLNDGAFFSNYFVAAANGLCDIQTSTLIVKKQVFHELGTFNPALMRHQDWDLWWRIAHHYPAIGFVAEPQIIHHLLYDNQVVNQRRLEAKKGGWLADLIDKHLEMARHQDSLKEFQSFAGTYVRNSILSMLFIGFKQEARTMLNRFSMLLKPSERLFFRGMLLTALLSLPLFRVSVWLAEKMGMIKMSHRNWDYLRARKEMEMQKQVNSV